MTEASSSHFLSRAFTAAGAAVSLVVAAALVWAALDLLLLLFAAVLAAQLLIGLSDALKRHTGLSHGWALAAVCLALAVVVALGVLVLAPPIAEQARSLGASLPTSIEEARARLGDTRAGEWLGGALPSASELRDMSQQVAGGGGVVRRVTGLFTTVVGALTSAVVIGFLGLFVAAQPRTYRDGLVRLIRPQRRARAREVLEEVGQTLQWWLMGKALSMALVGVLSTVGLWLLGIPMALALGLIAALMAFIPNIGPVLSVIPAALVALSQSPASAGYVVLLYLGIQTVESYIITPLVQQRAVSLPPGLILGTQVVVGGLLGGLGLILATPMLAATVVLIEMLYVEDVLGEDARV